MTLPAVPPRTVALADVPAQGLPGLGAGRPLSADLRRRFEQAFGWDFSAVRLHSGSAATIVSARLGARAFTQGRNIVFGATVAAAKALKLPKEKLTSALGLAGAQASGLMEM